MLISALAAIALFAAPDAGQSGAGQAGEPGSEAKAAAAEAKQPTKTCYTAKPSGSRLPRKICVTNAGPRAQKSVDEAKSADKPKPE
jgi:hypothetical protein